MVEKDVGGIISYDMVKREAAVYGEGGVGVG